MNRHAATGLLFAVLLVSRPGAVLAQTAGPPPTATVQSDTPKAGDPWELWPELNLYTRLGPQTRLYFASSYADGKESDVRTLDLAGYFDVTIGPKLRHSRQKADWQTKKYFWARIGYDHIFKAEGETKVAPEERGIVSLLARYYLPAGILVEARTRADLRWIEGEYSTRYRFRLEVNRDFDVSGHVVTPFVQAEYFYDNRYNGWSRALYVLGAEMAVTKHFRVEPSVARQLDRLPNASGLYAFAFVARWYY
jgi:hypothetical protein